MSYVSSVVIGFRCNVDPAYPPQSLRKFQLVRFTKLGDHVSHLVELESRSHSDGASYCYLLVIVHIYLVKSYFSVDVGQTQHICKTIWSFLSCESLWWAFIWYFRGCIYVLMCIKLFYDLVYMSFEISRGSVRNFEPENPEYHLPGLIILQGPHHLAVNAMHTIASSALTRASFSISILSSRTIWPGGAIRVLISSISNFLLCFCSMFLLVTSEIRQSCYW